MLPTTASAFTRLLVIAGSPRPLPKADHSPVVLFQRATCTALTPPALVKLPPTYTCAPSMVIAFTLSFRPLPSADQPSLVWFQRAMKFAGFPPAELNRPPT